MNFVCHSHLYSIYIFQYMRLLQTFTSCDWTCSCNNMLQCMIFSLCLKIGHSNLEPLGKCSKQRLEKVSKYGPQYDRHKITTTFSNWKCSNYVLKMQIKIFKTSADVPLYHHCFGDHNLKYLDWTSHHIKAGSPPGVQYYSVCTLVYCVHCLL